MRKLALCLALNFVALLLAASCISACVSNEDEANKKLTISVKSDPGGFMEDAVERFRSIHPDIEIELHNYQTDNQKYREQVGAQLMAGEADDLLSFLGFNDKKYFDSGLMADFYPIMQNDPDFNEADYFMTVIDGFTYQNRLLVFPIFYTYWGIGVNEKFSPELTEKFKQYDKISLKEVFNLYNTLENKVRYYLSENMDALTSLNLYINTYVAFESKKCYFNTPEFIKFITDAKSATDPQKIADGLLGYTIGGGFDEIRENELALKYLFWQDAISVELYMLPDNFEENFIHRIPLVTDNGKLIAGAMDAFFMNAASKNKELAWEFIKFLSSTKAMQFSSCFPVHRQLFETYIQRNIARPTWNIQSVLGKVKPGKTDEEIIAILKAYAEMPLEHAIYLDIEAIKEIMQSFYNGVMTAEQAASELQNKVSLYLME
jgi:ABC-type glycerol-3-phosphate transport system substrate-binding protein